MGELEPDQRQQADFSSAASRLWVQADTYGIRLGLTPSTGALRMWE